MYYLYVIFGKFFVTYHPGGGTFGQASPSSAAMGVEAPGWEGSVGLGQFRKAQKVWSYQMSYPPNFIQLIIQKEKVYHVPGWGSLKIENIHSLMTRMTHNIPMVSLAADRGADGAEAAERTREGPSASMCIGSCIKKLSSVPWQLKMLEEEEEIYLQSMNKNWRLHLVLDVIGDVISFWNVFMLFFVSLWGWFRECFSDVKILDGFGEMPPRFCCMLRIPFFFTLGNWVSLTDESPSHGLL